MSGFIIIQCIILFIGQAPRQPGNVECGYYIMCYMRDIVKYNWPIGKIPINVSSHNLFYKNF